jgi:YesN/AraC family two-component response regulator
MKREKYQEKMTLEILSDSFVTTKSYVGKIVKF